MLFNLYGIEIEKLHHFSLALIILNIYFLDSVTFAGVYVPLALPLAEIKCPNNRCAREELLGKENISGCKKMSEGFGQDF